MTCLARLTVCGPAAHGLRRPLTPGPLSRTAGEGRETNTLFFCPLRSLCFLLFDSGSIPASQFVLPASRLRRKTSETTSSQARISHPTPRCKQSAAAVLVGEQLPLDQQQQAGPKASATRGMINSTR